LHGFEDDEVLLDYPRCPSSLSIMTWTLGPCLALLSIPWVLFYRWFATKFGHLTSVLCGLAYAVLLTPIILAFTAILPLTLLVVLMIPHLWKHRIRQRKFLLLITVVWCIWTALPLVFVMIFVQPFHLGDSGFTQKGSCSVDSVDVHMTARCVFDNYDYHLKGQFLDPQDNSTFSFQIDVTLTRPYSCGRCGPGPGNMSFALTQTRFPVGDPVIPYESLLYGEDVECFRNPDTGEIAYALAVTTLIQLFICSLLSDTKMC
jgi:energy-coupling factor transporter transmembrane protein EcfT